MSQIFISYPRDNGCGQRLAEQIEQQLQAVELSVFRDVSGISPGEPWAKRLQSELLNSKLIVLVVSKKTDESDWVLNEINLAQKNQIFILPVLAEKVPLPFGLLHLQALDFSEKSDWSLLISPIRKRCGLISKVIQDLATGSKESDKIHRTLQELSIFVERPKEAFEFVLKKIQTCENQVCAYLCLFTKKLDDKPDDYVRALTIKLQEQVGSGRDSILDIIERESFEPENIKYDVWQSTTYKAFYRTCLQELLADLQRNTEHPSRVENSGTGVEVMEKDILQLLAALNKPKFFMLIVRNPTKRAWQRLFFAFKTRRIVKQRFRWLKKFNEKWRQLAEKSVLQFPYPLLILFCIETESNVLHKEENKITLQKIHIQALENWIAFVMKSFRFLNAYNTVDQIKFTGDFQTTIKKTIEDLEEAVDEDEKQMFPLTYKQFKQQIDKLTVLNQR